MSSDLILGIETSCDETATALYDSEKGLIAHKVFSQIELHRDYGGVVPELASRDHISKLLPMIDHLLKETNRTINDVNAIAYTAGPGLSGALLVGSVTANALAFSLGIPSIPVHHMEAHLLAPLLESERTKMPFVALLVSGGHTLLVYVKERGEYQLIGQTLDDAAGEAFDKASSLLGLGYPGGPAIDNLALEGDRSAFQYPRSLVQENPATLPDDRRFAFSFSGLKTAVVNHVRSNPGVATEDVVASFQEAVVDTLVTKLKWALESTGVEAACLGGGVAANSRLRERFLEVCDSTGVKGCLPSRAMCTDNAAMVAAAGYWGLKKMGPSPLNTGVDPNLGLV